MIVIHHDRDPLIKMRSVKVPRTSRFHLPVHHRQLQDYRLRRILDTYKSQSSKSIPVVRAGVESHLGLSSRDTFKAMYKYTDLASYGRALLKPLLQPPSIKSAGAPQGWISSASKSQRHAIQPRLEHLDLLRHRSLALQRLRPRFTMVMHLSALPRASARTWESTSHTVYNTQ